MSAGGWLAERLRAPGNRDGPGAPAGRVLPEGTSALPPDFFVEGRNRDEIVNLILEMMHEGPSFSSGVIFRELASGGRLQSGDIRPSDMSRSSRSADRFCGTCGSWRCCGLKKFDQSDSVTFAADAPGAEMRKFHS